MNTFMTAKKRWLVAGVAAATQAGGAYAFAATLNVTSNTLAAGSTLVQACQTNAKVSYTTVWNPGLNEFDVGTVTVTMSGLTGATCDSFHALVALTGPVPVPVSPPLAIAANTAIWVLPPPVVAASAVTDVHVVVF
jgi:hypothetical protein